MPKAPVFVVVGGAGGKVLEVYRPSKVPAPMQDVALGLESSVAAGLDSSRELITRLHAGEMSVEARELVAALEQIERRLEDLLAAAFSARRRTERKFGAITGARR